MKKIRSYSSIWSVEKMIYAIDNQTKLPIPLSISQIGWLMLSLFVVITFKNLPPISLINSGLIRYVVIPIGITWFMSQKTFDGKKPFSFVKTVIGYFFRHKLTFADEKIKLRKTQNPIAITAVRSEKYHVLSD